MTREHIVATWLVADPSVDDTEVEAWCRSAAGTEGEVLAQMGPGRGRLTSGHGALMVRDAGHAPTQANPAWCIDRIEGEFRLRQVHAPREVPDVATTSCMLLTRTFVPPPMRSEFRDWLEREHSQRQLDVPGNHWYLGYEEVGGRESFMNFWGIDDPGVADGPAWDQARLTPWRERMVPAMAGMDRGFYRPVSNVDPQ